MNRRTELLSPAGSFEILKAVANAGADAVYAAGTQFGARAYAGNFTQEELLAAIDLLHLKGKRFYLTVNTLLKNTEIRTLYAYLSPLYEAGLDAVIVQDLGVMRFVKQYFPKLPIHASTQTTVTGAYGAKLLLEAGCSRIVTARELSLEEISHIKDQTGAEIESFVHGALCYAYSGQCLMSSMIGGRSGNRGRCAQPCRLSYEAVGMSRRGSNGAKHPSTVTGRQKESYPLSLKDLCAVDIIPKLVAHGVYSFKIEGRMKQAEYAAGVTSIYRKYIDLYESGAQYQVSQEDHQRLLDLGNRCGFTEGYFTQRNGRNMVTFQKPSHEKRTDRLQADGKTPCSEIENKEKINGILRLFPGKPANLVLQWEGVQIKVKGDAVQAAKSRPLSQDTVLEKMKKTGNTPFVFEELDVEMAADAFLPVGALNQLRRTGLEKLEEAILTPYRRTKETSAPYDPGATQTASPKKAGQSARIRLSVLTETLEQFEEVLGQPEVDRVYLEVFALDRQQLLSELPSLVDRAHKAGKACFLALPYVFRMETARWYESQWRCIAASGADGYLARNLEELSFLKDMGVSAIQGDYGLYSFSNEAVRGMQELSLYQYTLPVELNEKELKNMDCSAGEILLYGYQPLMLSAQCLQKTMGSCGRTEKITYLKDRYGKLFPVRNHCDDCYNVIYNITPLALFHQLENIQSLSPKGLRISFTLENRREVCRILDYYRQAKAGKLDKNHYLEDFTNGHFRRGVE